MWRTGAPTAALWAAGALAAAGLAHGLDRRRPGAAAGLLLTVAVVALVPGADLLPDVVSTSAPVGPLGYENATGIAYVVAVAAAVALGSRTGRAGRAAAVAGGLACAATVAASGSVAAIAGVALVLAAVAVAGAVGDGPVVGGLVVLVGASIVATVALGAAGAAPSGGAAGGEDGDGTGVAAVLTGRRLQLWDDAARIAAAEPWTGAGVGAFADTSPTARSDRDVTAAHHAYLQTAAEHGVPVAALVALAAAGAPMVARGRGAAGAGVAAAAVAVAVAACLDYGPQAAVVSLPVAALVGGVTAWPARPRARAGR